MKAILLVLTLCLSLPTHAFFSLMDTGKLKKKGEYQVMGEGQVLFDAPKGFNLNGRFSTGVTEDGEAQFEAGVGSVDYYLGGFYKWMPYPDTASQPAIGGRAGFVFADVNDLSTYGFNVTPMISKMIQSGVGEFTPYGGIQMGLLNNVDDTNFTMQAVLGLEWVPNRWDFPSLKGFEFLIEYGFEIDDAFNYFSFGASYDF